VAGFFAGRVVAAEVGLEAQAADAQGAYPLGLLLGELMP
jgi:hypothetical protein